MIDSRPNSDDTPPIGQPGDHPNICKPRHELDATFQHLVDALRVALILKHRPPTLEGAAACDDLALEMFRETCRRVRGNRPLSIDMEWDDKARLFAAVYRQAMEIIETREPAAGSSGSYSN